MRVRKFSKCDARRASYLVRKTMRLSLSRCYTGEVIDALCRANTPAKLARRADNRDYLVAFENNKMVGFMGLKGNEIKTAFVNPGYQGRNVGARLLKRIESLAKKKDLKELKVHSSIISEGFYNKMGFKKQRKVQSSVENLKFTDILMRKAL